MTLLDPTQWFRYVSSVQRMINSTFNRAIGTNPFQLLTGTRMNNKTDLRIQELINEEILHDFENSRDELRKKAKEEIQKIQAENRKSYNSKRKKPNKYKVNDVVLIKRTQINPGSKFVARITSTDQRNALLSKWKELKDLSIGISEDYSSSLRLKRRFLNNERKRALADGKTAKLKFDKLVINNETYICNSSCTELVKLKNRGL